MNSKGLSKVDMMKYTKDRPLVSLFCYVILSTLKEIGAIDSRNKEFIEYIYKEGFEFLDIRNEVLQSGLVNDHKDIWSLNCRLFCGELVVNSETIEHIAGDWESTFDFAINRLQDIKSHNVDSYISIPIEGLNLDDSVENYELRV